MKGIHSPAAAATVLAALAHVAAPRADAPDTDPSASSFSEFVTPQGDIRLPQRDYRSRWTHLGTFVVPADRDAGFHDVYAQPEAVQAYLESGEFPDGAVIIKEVRSMRTAKMTTGEATWAGDPAQWFVMVKDRKRRYPGHPLWGKGWGWALFEAGAPAVNVAASYKADCLACHLPAQATDWIFVQGYPSIRK